MDWIPFAEERRARYREQHGELDERGLVRKGNLAYAAALALLMAHEPGAADWFRRAASCWRESWRGGESWGRPIGALKALLLAGENDAAVDRSALWTLGLGTATAASPIGRYAGALALLSLGRDVEARHVAESLRERDDFPHDVGDALATLAGHDVVGYAEAIDSIVESFETRTQFLEDARVADTALALDVLARRRGIELPLPESDVLPGV
jgi:hypothetical protein